MSDMMNYFLIKLHSREYRASKLITIQVKSDDKIYVRCQDRIMHRTFFTLISEKGNCIEK